MSGCGEPPSRSTVARALHAPHRSTDANSGSPSATTTAITRSTSRRRSRVLAAMLAAGARRRRDGGRARAPRARAAPVDGHRRGRRHPARRARRSSRRRSRRCSSCPTGVEFDAIDGAHGHHPLRASSAPKRATGEHLKTLARVSRLLRNKAFRDRLVGARRAPSDGVRAHRARGGGDRRGARRDARRDATEPGDSARAERSRASRCGELVDDPRSAIELAPRRGRGGARPPDPPPAHPEVGLALAGHFYGVVPTRVQVLGETELSYLDVAERRGARASRRAASSRSGCRASSSRGGHEPPRALVHGGGGDGDAALRDATRARAARSTRSTRCSTSGSRRSTHAPRRARRRLRRRAPPARQERHRQERVRARARDARPSPRRRRRRALRLAPAGHGLRRSRPSCSAITSRCAASASSTSRISSASPRCASASASTSSCASASGTTRRSTIASASRISTTPSSARRSASSRVPVRPGRDMGIDPRDRGAQRAPAARRAAHGARSSWRGSRRTCRRAPGGRARRRDVGRDVAAPSAYESERRRAAAADALVVAALMPPGERHARARRGSRRCARRPKEDE